LSELATCHLWLGEHEKALEYFRESLEIHRAEISDAAAVQSERQQLMMLVENRSALDSFLCLSLKAPKYCNEALEEVLAWQGAVLARQRAIRAVSDRPEIAPLLRELQTITTRLAALSIASPTAQPSASWKSQIAELSAKQEHLEAQIAAASGQYREAKATITVADLKAALPADSALALYFEFLYVEPKSQAEGGGIRSEYRLIAFVVRPQADVQLVDLGVVEAKPMDSDIEAWRKAVSNGQGLEIAGRRLRERLWTPVEAHFGGAKTILISPYRDLAMLPFAALPGRAAGTFLIEDYSLVVVPAAQGVAWASTHEQGSASPGMLVVGDVDYDRQKRGAAPWSSANNAMMSPSTAGLGQAPRDERSAAFSRLPGTAAELKSIADLYQSSFAGSAQSLKGAEASEANLIEAAENHRYLHLATHGYFAAERFKSAMSRDFLAERSNGIQLTTHQSLSRYHPGLLCGLALAGANEPTEDDDGILTAAEVNSLNLSKVELIVLSACETGLGNFSGSDGMLGLQRSFQVAGARTVVASLWSVPDEATKLLMVRFYENLWKKKMGKLTALREAQIWMLREGAEQPGMRRELAARGLVEAGTGDRGQGTGNNRVPPYYWGAWVLSGDWR
jgi:CHAT domain-containing protein